MKNNKIKLLISVIFILLGIVIISRESKANVFSRSTFYKEQQLTEINQERLLRAQPPIKSQDSLERKQINQRTKLWNDPYKVAYLYVFSRGSGPIGYFTVKGKVSSVNSSITNPEQILSAKVDTIGSSGRTAASQPIVVSAPAEDGSYGTNGNGIFAFTTSGIYLETNMEYLLVDRPLKITTVSLGVINR